MDRHILFSFLFGHNIKWHSLLTDTLVCFCSKDMEIVPVDKLTQESNCHPTTSNHLCDNGGGFHPLVDYHHTVRSVPCSFKLTVGPVRQPAFL